MVARSCHSRRSDYARWTRRAIAPPEAENPTPAPSCTHHTWSVSASCCVQELLRHHTTCGASTAVCKIDCGNPLHTELLLQPSVRGWCVRRTSTAEKGHSTTERKISHMYAGPSSSKRVSRRIRRSLASLTGLQVLTTVRSMATAHKKQDYPRCAGSGRRTPGCRRHNNTPLIHALSHTPCPPHHRQTGRSDSSTGNAFLLAWQRRFPTTHKLSWQPPWLSGARAQGMRTGCFGSEDSHCVRKEWISQRSRWFMSN
jgi:hypothetical protein